MITTALYSLVIVFGMIIIEIFVPKLHIEKEDHSLFSKEQTQIFKGIAIFLVFIGHVGTVNQVRIFAPLGGMGVAMFLICSGYGLEKSYHDAFSAKKYVAKRLTNVFLPYFITRICVVPLSGGVGWESISSFLLDVFLLKPSYGLGWYLTFLAFWYAIFFILKILPNKIKRYEIIIMLCICACVFFFSNDVAWSQQSLSFFTGFCLAKMDSHAKKRIEKNALLIAIVFFILGSIAFAIKQYVSIDVDSYLMWIVKLIYRYGWAVSIILIVWNATKKRKIGLTSFYYLGFISYEVYLIHGYFMNEHMEQCALVLPCILSVIFFSVGLRFVEDRIKNIISKPRSV